MCGGQTGIHNDSLLIQCMAHYDKVSACITGMSGCKLVVNVSQIYATFL